MDIVTALQEADKFRTGTGVPKDLQKAFQLYAAAAQRGHPTALTNLGNLFKEGSFQGCPPPPKNLQEAMKCYLSAGDVFLQGRGYRRNPKEARRLFMNVLEIGEHPHAFFCLGLITMNGDGVEKDEVEAVKNFKKAASLKHPGAFFHLGKCLCTGVGPDGKNEKEGLKMLTQASSSGSVEALLELGHVYKEGKYGVEKNLKTASRNFELASANGHPMALVELAHMLKSGEGQEAPDLDKALALYKKAASMGFAGALVGLAECYEKGEGVEKDPQEAASLYNKAADAYNGKEAGPRRDVVQSIEYYQKAVDLVNDSHALFQIGFCYLHGDGVPADSKKALKLYNQAAEGGHPDALCALAKLYYDGEMVDQDTEKGIDLFRKAAEQKNPRAQCALAAIYEEGKHVTKDDDKAVEYYVAAAESVMQPWMHCDNDGCGEVASGGLQEHMLFRTCDGCKKSIYCTPKCQKEHWEASHKDECTPIAARGPPGMRVPAPQGGPALPPPASSSPSSPPAPTSIPEVAAFPDSDDDDSKTSRICNNAKCTTDPSEKDIKYSVCGGCKTVKYCSTACQKAAWKTHKKMCKK